MVEDASNSSSNSEDPFDSLPLLYFLPRSVITLEGAASAENLDDLEALHKFLMSRLIDKNDLSLSARGICLNSYLRLFQSLIDKKFKNAEKELRRLQGSSFVDDTSNRCVSGSRMRRQGILGKTSKYKHSYAAICDNAFKHISSVRDSAQTISVSSAGNNYGPSNSTSSLIEGNNANREMVNDIGITGDKETDAGRFINPLMKDSNDVLLGSLLDACCDLGEGQTFNLLQKSLKMEQIDMHQIQLPKFNRFTLSSQTSLLKTDNSVESNMLTAFQQTWASTVNDRTPMRSQSDLDTKSLMTSPTPPKSPFAAISSFCRNKSSTTTKRDPFMWSSMVSIPGRVSFFASPSEVDMPSSHGGTVQQDTGRVTSVANTVPMDPNNNVSVITGTFFSERLEEGILGSKLHSPKTQTDELSGFAGTSGSTPFSSAPSKASGGIRQQDTTEFVGDAHENGLVLLDGFPSRGLEEGITRTGSHSFSMQGDCTTSSADQSQEKNLISEISNGPTRDLQSQVLVKDNVIKDSSGHQATDQRADEYSNPRNSVRAQSATGDTQFYTLDECNARNDNHFLEVPTDGPSFSASGVSGKVSNGSVKDVDSQSGAIKGRVEDNVSKTIAVEDNVVRDSSDHQATDQRADEYSDPRHSVRVQSANGDTRFHTLDECNAKNNNHCLEMPTDGSNFLAFRVSGKVSNGSVKDVDSQSGTIKGRVQDNVQATVNPAAGMQEALVGDSGDAITVVPRSGSRQISGIENGVVERNPQKTSKAPSKALVRKRSMKEASGGRKSLIGAGTEWNSGLRRSTRNRSRPLEYWRGERFVYGRIHNSLVTVIGVKCASPAPNDKDQPVLKVKSFVPDEYSHLVDLASSH